MDLLLYTLVALVGILIRVLVGYAPYSGEHDAPRFGDYEAQRHWMEITLNLPAHEWYAGSSRNDLSYWGLDYPPLTAYHELLLGYFSRWFEPSSVELYTSRGYETETHRNFMRMTVLVSDVFFYFIGAFLLSRLTPSKGRFGAFFVLILNPAAIWIDHGHFQYNTVAVGLLFIAIWATISNRYVLGAIAYTCSFLFKQTLMYFAPAFLAYMLGEALRLPSWRDTGIRVGVLGLTVIGTIVVVFAPLLLSCDYSGCMAERSGHILTRVFPFGRGLLEDYVANIWTILTPVLRLRSMTAIKQKFCAIASLTGTVVGFSEVFVSLVKRPDPKFFTVALAACSFSFYLFSWMVHEKAILLPLSMVLAAAPCLANLKISDLIFRMIEASILSMWRLMKIEGNYLAAFAVLGIAWITFRDVAGYKAEPTSTSSKVMLWMNLGAFLMIVFDLYVPAPTALPYLWILGNCATCCATFVICWRQLVVSCLKSQGKKLD